LRNRIETEQELILETNFDEAISSESESELDKHTMAAAITFGQNHKYPLNSGGVHPFNGGLSGLKIQEAPHMNKDSSPFTVFFLFFMDVNQMLVAQPIFRHTTQ
jgi:hypothetical protein